MMDVDLLCCVYCGGGGTLWRGAWQGKKVECGWLGLGSRGIRNEGGEGWVRYTCSR